MTASVEDFDQTHIRYHSRERCTATVEAFPNSLKTRTHPCRHSAAYKVNGKKLCALHAGRALLAHHLGKDLPYGNGTS